MPAILIHHLIGGNVRQPATIAKANPGKAVKALAKELGETELKNVCRLIAEEGGGNAGNPNMFTVVMLQRDHQSRTTMPDERFTIEAFADCIGDRFLGPFSFFAEYEAPELVETSQLPEQPADPSTPEGGEEPKGTTGIETPDAPGEGVGTPPGDGEGNGVAPVPGGDEPTAEAETPSGEGGSTAPPDAE